MRGCNGCLAEPPPGPQYWGRKRDLGVVQSPQYWGFGGLIWLWPRQNRQAQPEANNRHADDDRQEIELRLAGGAVFQALAAE